MKSKKRGVGTFAQPNIVESMENFRMIGCVCNEDDTSCKYMYLYAGQKKRCECGYWFELKQVEGPQKYHLPI